MNPFLLRLFSDVPLIESGCFTAMLAASNAEHAAEHPGLARIRSQLRPQATLREDGIAVVPIEGALMRKPDVFELAFMGVEDSGAVHSMISDVASDPKVRGIILNMDTPGGMVMGGTDIADLVREVNKTKPVVTHSGGMIASLGYYIASQGSAIVTTRSAQTGSIGAIVSVADTTKMLEAFGVKLHVFRSEGATLKAPGNGPLTEDQLAHLQARADKAGADFQKAVKAGRGEMPEEAKKGQMFGGREAKSLGLIDAVGSFSFAVGHLRSLLK